MEMNNHPEPLKSTSSKLINITIPTAQSSKHPKNQQLNKSLFLTFHQAARDGQHAILKEYLSSFGKDKKKINAKDGEQTSALHYAVRYGHFSVVKLLVENGANINIHDENGATPLHYASRHISKKKRSVDFISDLKFQLPLEENHKHKWFHQPLIFNKTQNSNINKLHFKSVKPNEIKIKKEPLDTKKSEVFSSLISNVSHINFEIHNLNYRLNSPRFLESRKSLGFTNGSHQLDNETKKAVVIVGAVSQKEMKYMKNVDALILPPVKNVTTSDGFLKSSSLKDNLNERDNKKSISIINNSAGFITDNIFKEKLKDERDQGDSILIYLLEQKANINAKDFNDSTPLHYAVMRGNKFATKQLLLQKHIHKEATDQAEMTPLHCAALSGSYDACKLLLDHGANILCQDKENMTPLHLAAMEGHIGIVSLLFDTAEKKGDAVLAKLIGCINRDKETALHLAVENNHIDIVELCIKKGFKVNSERENMISPLHLACTSGMIDIAKLLVENGANIESTNSLKETPLHRASMFNRTDIIEYLLSEGAYIDCRDKDNETPLLMAVRKNYLESVKLLLEYSADITVKDANDKTCLFIAAEENSKEVCEILCQKNIKCILEEFDKNEMTPLHIASKEGHESIVQALLGLGACIDAKNEENLTPLHLAAKNGHARTVEILLSNVLSIVNDVDGSSNTPLHLAAMQGHVKVVEILIKSGADVEARNAGLWTPLDCAAFHGWVNCAQCLLDADSLINPKDKNKVSSLQLACKEGHVDMVKLLISKNADISWKDHLGRNCLDYAIDNKQREAVIAIITSENWKVALRNSTFEGNKLTTPMRKLIKKLPDIAEQVFNQCITGNGLPIEHPQYKITCCYEFLEDFFTPWGPSVSKSKEYKNQYYRSIGLPADKISFGEKLRRKTKLCNFGVNTFDVKQNHPLDFMVKNQRTKLLCHPLVTYLLRRKWSLCGRYVYYSRLLLYIMFLIFVTSYTLSIRSDLHSVVCEEKEPNVTRCYCQSLKSSVSREVKFFTLHGRYIILTLSTTSLSIEFIKLLYEAHHYFQLQRSIELSAYICSIVYASGSTSHGEDDKDSLRCSEWYRSLGAATTTLSWLALALFLRQFPKLGTYIFIFSHIMKTFAQFSVIFLLFMISFGLGLHLVMYETIPYSVPSRSLAKMIVGMTGEFSFDSLYNNKENPKPLSMSWALLILFIIVNCVVVMKLLAGLAIGEINDIKKQAVLNRLAMLVDLTLCVEKVLPIAIQNKLVRMEESIYPNMKKASVLWSFWSFESPVTKVNKKSDLKIVKKEHKKMKATVYKLRTAMKQMEAQNDRIENMLSVISKHLHVNY